MPENLIYPFPEPETIGMTLASEEVARVTSVAPGSIAEKAGIRPGDDITAVADQPLISIADISYALHHTADEASLPVTLLRNGKDSTTTLVLPNGWRRHSDVTERATIWPERGMALGGIRLEPAEGQGVGLKVKGLGKYGIHAAGLKAGFKEGDVILAFGDISTPTTEAALIGHLLQSHQQGDKVTVKVKRGDQTLDLQLPMQ